jgi:hypothetical protein
MGVVVGVSDVDGAGVSLAQAWVFWVASVSCGFGCGDGLGVVGGCVGVFVGGAYGFVGGERGWLMGQASSECECVVVGVEVADGEVLAVGAECRE